MSIINPSKPAKLIIGLFMQRKGLFKPAAQELIEKFGDADIISPWFSFDYTDYYKPEMGAPLYRRVLSFKKNIRQSSLSKIKIITNNLELKYSENGRRRINIDPGYMLLERFVLATGKNYSHRIYIGMGVYADLTLIYQGGGYRKLAWTYPDYAAPDMIMFLELVRKKYRFDLIGSGLND